MTSPDPRRFTARIGFRSRLTCFAIFLVVLSMGLASWVSYTRGRASLETHLGRELLAVVNSAVPAIEGDLLRLIYRKADGNIAGKSEFDEIRAALVRVKQANGLQSSHGSPLYLMRPTPDFATTHEVEFVVMTDPDRTGAWFVGNHYKARPHNIEALQGKPAATGVYEDSEGLWISANAPVRDSAGNVVAILQADRPINFFYEEAGRQAVEIAYAALAILALASVLAFWMGGGMSRPVRLLRHATLQIAGGHLDHRVHIDRADEIGELASSVNAMALQLSLARENMLSQQQGLEQALQKAEAAGQAKSQFLATISHELRTPLNALLGFAELLQGAKLDPEQGFYIQSMRASGQDLLAIVNDVLDFSRIEAGQLTLASEPFSVHAVIDNVRNICSVPARAKGLRLTFRTDGPRDAAAGLVGDSARIAQVLVNLVGNAIKFTDSGSVDVAVRASSHGGRVMLRFEVTDTGIGIPPEARERIFEPFTQVDGSATRKHGGTGMGLALCQRLTNLMGGRIGVESRPGVGSTFWFEAPLQWERKPSAASATRDPHTAPISGPLLLAEDNPVNRAIATKMLAKLGYTAEVAENGLEAVRLWEQRRYSCILMDCQMPEMDGFQATREIREREAVDGSTPPSFIVAVTANAMPGDRERCLAAGMDAYIAKPVSLQELARVFGQASPEAVTR